MVVRETLNPEKKEISKKRLHKKIIINYFIDLGITVLFLINFTIGIIKFFNLYIESTILISLSNSLTPLHDWSGLILGILVFIHLALNLKWMIAKTKNIKRTIKKKKVALNYFVNLGLIISLSIVFATGIIKFPSLLITRELRYSNSKLLLILHDFSGIALGLLSFFHIILYRKWIIGTTRAIFRRLK